MGCLEWSGELYFKVCGLLFSAPSFSRLTELQPAVSTLRSTLSRGIFHKKIVWLVHCEFGSWCRLLPILGHSFSSAARAVHLFILAQGSPGEFLIWLRFSSGDKEPSIEHRTTSRIVTWGPQSYTTSSGFSSLPNRGVRITRFTLRQYWLQPMIIMLCLVVG